MIDVTGGAPELNPNLTHMIAQLSLLAPKIMLRTNLTALYECNSELLLENMRDKPVVLVSFSTLFELGPIGSSTPEQETGKKALQC